MTGDGALLRRLGTRDAAVLGLGSMLGAGVFAVWAPAAAAAGWWLLAALALAGGVAWCNATSTAALAVHLPVSGGAYAFGRARLGPWWGYLAGCAFLVGKTASAAAMALTIGTHLWPSHARAVAVVAVLVLVAVDAAGITRTARATRVLLAVTLVVLAVVVGLAVAAAVGGDEPVRTATPVGGPGGVLTAAGLLFFAFAGYARIATLAEEVRDPARTIPRAVSLALGAAVAVYAAVGVVLLVAVGPAALAGSDRPLADAVAAGPAPGLVPLVTAGAVAAAGGALLGLVAGITRTALAMARERDLPAPLARVDARRGTPLLAHAVLAVAVGALVLTGGLTAVVGASSAGVLVYYAVANAAAWTLPAGERPARWVPGAGLVACLVLVAALPPRSVLVAPGVLAAAGLLRLVTVWLASVRLASVRRRGR